MNRSVVPLLFCAMAIFSCPTCAQQGDRTTVFDDTTSTGRPGNRGLSGFDASSYNPSFRSADTSTTSTSSQPRGKMKLVKRQRNFRQQLGFSLGMMAFIAIMMTSAQTWNPN